MQRLAYALWDMGDYRSLSSGSLPLTPGAELTWFGFTELRALAAGDSAGVVHTLRQELGGCWVPVFRCGGRAATA